MDTKRILVIDDEPELCQILRQLLESEGYRVETVENASQTVASLLVQHYDLVTVDLKMPEMDGADVAKLARTLNDRIPVVVISAYLTPERKDQFKEMGIRHFLAKPCQKSDLLAAVESAWQESESLAT